MLDYIGRRVFLEQPAREDLTPAFGLGRARRTFIDNKLHESTLIRVCFPRGSFLARANAYDNFPKTNCFTGFQFNVPSLTITFVQQA